MSPKRIPQGERREKKLTATPTAKFCLTTPIAKQPKPSFPSAARWNRRLRIAEPREILTPLWRMIRHERGEGTRQPILMGDANISGSGESFPGAPHLRRVLTLWDLIFYGMVLIQPIAPVPLFGVVQERSHGYIVDTILIAMFAMMITAFSYGRMAALYPSAGSAYTYVGRGLNLHLGFLVGWAMFLDYLLQPLINAVWVAETIHGWVHWIPTLRPDGGVCWRP